MSIKKVSNGNFPFYYSVFYYKDSEGTVEDRNTPGTRIIIQPGFDYPVESTVVVVRNDNYISEEVAF